jgi:hypothetical protein
MTSQVTTIVLNIILLTGWISKLDQYHNMVHARIELARRFGPTVTYTN